MASGARGARLERVSSTSGLSGSAWNDASERIELPRRAERRNHWLLWSIVVAVLALPCAGVFVLANSGHRAAPHPLGMVFRVEERAVESPFDKVVVFAVDRDGPAIAVFTSDGTIDSSDSSEGQRLIRAHKAMCRIYRYPGGELLERVTDAAARTLLETKLPSERDQCVGDFDGDGTIDGITFDRDGFVSIRSGTQGRVLFEDRDELEYENPNRAFFLGDLDGDGTSEVALVHPRQDRSRYDFELWDALFGAKSWVSVVSWSRMDHRASR